MEYRGKSYTIFQGVEPKTWNWSVILDDHSVKSGETKSRSEALTMVVLAVDRALTVKTVRLQPLD